MDDRCRSDDTASSLKEKSLEFLSMYSKVQHVMDSTEIESSASHATLFMQAMDLSLPIIQQNPDFSCAGRCRMLILAHWQANLCDLSEKADIAQSSIAYTVNEQCNTSDIENELQTVLRILEKHLKSYTMWRYRRRLILMLPLRQRVQTLVDELLSVEHLLELDYRNFHTWNHRRWVTNAIHTLEEVPQLDANQQFSRKIITSCFGNYSAWHERALNQQNVTYPTTVQEELDLVRNAMYCDPADECAFLYADGMLRQLIEDGKADTIHSLQRRAAFSTWSTAIIHACFELMEIEVTMLRWPLWLLFRIVQHSAEMQQIESAELLEIFKPYSSRIETLMKIPKLYDECQFDQKKIREYYQTVLLQSLLSVDPRRKGCYLDLLGGMRR